MFNCSQWQITFRLKHWHGGLHQFSTSTMYEESWWLSTCFDTRILHWIFRILIKLKLCHLKDCKHPLNKVEINNISGLYHTDRPLPVAWIDILCLSLQAIIENHCRAVIRETYVWRLRQEVKCYPFRQFPFSVVGWPNKQIYIKSRN